MDLFKETPWQRIKREADERANKALTAPMDSDGLKGEVVVWPMSNS